MSHPKLILIVRHAEKPSTNDRPHLALRGKMRALGLSKLIPKTYVIDFVFASTSTKNSKRPYTTIKPTADALGLKVNTRYADKDAKKLSRLLSRSKRFSNKTVLICWHHGEIPKLIEALGFTSPYHKWPEDLFDRIVVLPAFGSAQDYPQRLLFGDSNT